jgi:hypothetical protein
MSSTTHWVRRSGTRRSSPWTGDGEPQYIRVRIGFFGTKSVLIPVRFVETDEDGKVLVLK